MDEEVCRSDYGELLDELPSSSPSISSGFCPRQLVFCPYQSSNEPTTLRVVVRKPLVSKLTKHIVRTYQVCNVEFKYTDELNPKRFLTSPSDAVFNDGHDNSQTQQSYLMESLVYKASAYIMQTPPDNCVPIATANAYKIARPCYLWLIMLEFEPFPSPLSFYLSGVALLYFWCFKNAGNRPAVVNRVPYASLLPQRDRSMGSGYLFIRRSVPFVASVLLKACKESDDESDMEIILAGLASLNDEIQWFKKEAT